MEYCGCRMRGLACWLRHVWSGLQRLQVLLRLFLECRLESTICGAGVRGMSGLVPSSAAAPSTRTLEINFMVSLARFKVGGHGFRVKKESFSALEV